MTLVFRVLLITFGVVCAVPHFALAWQLNDVIERRSVRRCRVALGWAVFFTAVAAIGVVGWRP